MGTKDALELETRRRIFARISSVPGTYFREIQRDVGLEVGEAEYHLAYMEKAGLISAQLEANRKRYYAKGTVDEHDRRLLALLRQEVPRQIVMEVLLAGKLSFQDIQEKVRKAKSTLSFHLSKLAAAGFLLVERSGKENVYRAGDEERTARCLIAYRTSFLDEAVDRFADAWLELRP